MQMVPGQIELAACEGGPKPDYWTRLARLNGRCRTALESIAGSAACDRGLSWRVTVRLRGEPPDTPFISIVRPSAADAIKHSLEEAEARGWHRRAAVLPEI